MVHKRTQELLQTPIVKLVTICGTIFYRWARYNTLESITIKKLNKTCDYGGAEKNTLYEW